jgi:hypothetical protein
MKIRSRASSWRRTRQGSAARRWKNKIALRVVQNALITLEYEEHFNVHRPHRALGQAQHRFGRCRPCHRTPARVSCGAIASAGSFTNTRRSHDVCRVSGTHTLTSVCRTSRSSRCGSDSGSVPIDCSVDRNDKSVTHEVFFSQLVAPPGSHDPTSTMGARPGWSRRTWPTSTASNCCLPRT